MKEQVFTVGRSTPDAIRATRAHKRRPGRRARPRGMMLIEIMVVITIMALLSAAVAIPVINYLNEAKRSVARQEATRLADAATLHNVVTGNYPDPRGDPFKQLLERGGIDKVPVDPWGRRYVYTLENGRPVVKSYGADGEPGGTDNDADISSEDPPGE